MKSIIKSIEQHSFKGFKAYMILSILPFLLFGCEKALEPDSPDFLLSTTAIFQDSAAIDAAMANLYAELRDNSTVSGSSSGMGVLLGLYTDELDNYRPDEQTENSFFNHTVLPNNKAVAEFWDSSYAIIYGANAIIEGLEASPPTNSEKELFAGEAYFLRAYLHFYLIQLFGDIPYIKTTDYTINSSVSRMPVEVVFLEIEKDLTLAKSLLPEMDGSGQKLRASKGVAGALLAKVYLYSEQWEKATQESNEVITKGSYTWQPDLDKVFLKESPSTIWQLKPEFDGAPTQEGETFIFTVGPPPLYALTDSFMANFEPGDQRRETWTKEITNGTETWFHPYKYQQRSLGGNSKEYSILFRLAEQYLIRAEASLHIGNLSQAKSDIDAIRLRAGLSPTTANTAEDIMDELLRQRRFELFTEQGNRWFDLKRTGRAAQVLGPIKSGWQTTDVLFPLPLKELLLNPNLNPQNPGY